MGKWMKGGIFCGLAGLLCWGIIFLTDVSYPHTLFNILLPLGLWLVFLSLPLFALSWIMDVYQDFKVRNYSVAILSIILGVVGVVWEISRLL